MADMCAIVEAEEALSEDDITILVLPEAFLLGIVQSFSVQPCFPSPKPSIWNPRYWNPRKLTWAASAFRPNYQGDLAGR